MPLSHFTYIAEAARQIAQHVKQGLCIRLKPETVPVKLCVRKAVDGSLCCQRHLDECPVKPK